MMVHYEVAAITHDICMHTLLRKLRISAYFNKQQVDERLKSIKGKDMRRMLQSNFEVGLIDELIIQATA